jgi:hypothetical protein
VGTTLNGKEVIGKETLVIYFDNDEVLHRRALPLSPQAEKLRVERVEKVTICRKI